MPAPPIAYGRHVSSQTAATLRNRARELRLVPPLIDIGVAVAFALFAVAEALVSPDVRSPGPFLALAGLSAVLLAWRRRFPLLVAVTVTAANIVTNTDGELSTLLALVLVCFTVGSETEPPRSYVGLIVVLGSFVGVSIRDGLEPSDLAAGLVFFAGPWVVGTAVRSRAKRAEEAVARAERLEAEREAENARAAAEERTRIARELHDIVAHSISVVTIQTQAVRRRLGPEHAAEAADLAAVETTAREALTEMRRLFGVLRSDGESLSLAPQPGLADLDRLVAQAGSDQLRVDLRVEGEPVELPPGLDLAAYRIVQEGLTNAIRHSRAGAVEVRLSYGPHRLDLAVTDDGRGPGRASAGGHGLIGVRERVALYGGTVELAAVPGGGARLAASLPLPGAP